MKQTFKTPCGHCGNTISVDVESAVEPQIVKEPCRCGVEESTHIVRALAVALCALFFCLLGGCWFSHYYTYKSIQLLPDKYKVEKVGPKVGGEMLVPDYKVVPKEEKDERK